MARRQREGLKESEEEKRATAARLAALYDADGIDAMIDRGGAAEPIAAEMTYFLELSLADGSGKEAAKVVGLTMLATMRQRQLMPTGQADGRAW